MPPHIVVPRLVFIFGIWVDRRPDLLVLLGSVVVQMECGG
jgi:hypothetical protein